MGNKEPWADVEKARANLINALGDMKTIDVVTLATVRDAIDGLIMRRLEYSGKPTITESFVLKAIEELRVVEREIGVPSEALKLLGYPSQETGESPEAQQQRNSEWDRQREQIAAGLAKNRSPE